jgi:hypothetical protein
MRPPVRSLSPNMGAPLADRVRLQRGRRVVVPIHDWNGDGVVCASGEDNGARFGPPSDNVLALFKGGLSLPITAVTSEGASRATAVELLRRLAHVGPESKSLSSVRR